MQIPESVFLMTVVAAITQFIKLLKEKQYDRAVNIFIAAVVGLIAGALTINGLDPITGLLAGLAAAGTVTIAQKVGGN